MKSLACCVPKALLRHLKSAASNCGTRGGRSSGSASLVASDQTDIPAYVHKRDQIADTRAEAKTLKIVALGMTRFWKSRWCCSVVQIMTCPADTTSTVSLSPQGSGELMRRILPDQPQMPATVQSWPTPRWSPAARGYTAADRVRGGTRELCSHVRQATTNSSSSPARNTVV